MTKLDHRKRRESDPGAVTSVSDVTRPYKPPKSADDRRREKKQQEEDEARRAEILRPLVERKKRKEIRKRIKEMEAEGVGDSLMRRAEYNSLLRELTELSKF